MKQGYALFLVILLHASIVEGQFRRFLYPRAQQSVVRVDDDPGEPLFLTPYLEQGKIEEAKRLR